MRNEFAIHILVLSNAPSLDVSLVRDILRKANTIAGDGAISVAIQTLNGQPVVLDDGGVLAPTQDAQIALPNAMIVVGMTRPARLDEEKIVRLVRHVGRTPAHIIGIGYGALIMAKAGVLDGQRATCHHDYLPMAQERYDKVQFSEQLYVVNGKRTTCAGHFAITDMLLHFIETNISESAAETLAGQLLAPPVRQAKTLQRIRTFAPLKAQSDPRLEKAIVLMQGHIETPLGIEEIAARVGVSVRQLQNLWQAKIGSSHQEYYLDLRLDRARSLLLHTDMQIGEIALASGFSSTATFARAFRQSNDTSARAYRNQNRDTISPILQRSTLRTLGTIIDRHAGFLYRNLNNRIYTVLFVTRGIERLLGYSPSEFMSKPGRNMASIIHPDDLAPMQENVDRAVQMQQNWDIEFRYIHRNGQPVWVHEVGSGVFDRSGRLLYVEGIIVRNLNPPDQYLDAMSID